MEYFSGDPRIAWIEYAKNAKLWSAMEEKYIKSM